MEHPTAKRILVLDDDYMLATRIADLLEDAGYEVAGPVRNVLEAKRIVGVDGIDCAVLAADLKCENSLSLAEEIADQGAPVLLVTNVGRDPRNGRERFPCIAKSFTRSELLARIGSLCAP